MNDEYPLARKVPEPPALIDHEGNFLIYSKNHSDIFETPKARNVQRSMFYGEHEEPPLDAQDYVP